MTKLLSGRIAKVPSANVSAERYQFIELSEVEPDLGLPSESGQVVASDAAGNRYWIRLDTANVSELTNLYFTNARAVLAVSPLLTTANISELNNQYFTNARAVIAITPLLTTSNVIEGTNQYFTNVRVLNALVTSNVTVNNLTISGDLIVQGNTVTLNTATLVVEDKNILLANGAPNASAADGAGITIAGANASIIYTSNGDKFTINKDVEILGNTLFGGNITFVGSNVQGITTITATETILVKNVISDSITANIWNRLYTSNVVETTNQYFTNVRVLQAVNPLLTTANVIESASNLYYTNARVYVAALDAVNPRLTTANVTELDNLYYTNSRVVSAVNPLLTTANVIESTSNLYYTNVRVYVAALDAVNPRLTTANVVESTSNLYYTNARVYVAALDAVNPRLTTANVVELTNQYFTNVRTIQAVTPLLTTANVTESIGNLYYTDARVNAAVQPTLTTANVTETAGNLYFTTSRARQTLSAGIGINYNSATGVISANTTQYFDANAIAAITPLLTTSNVIEGTNQYFTNARVLAALATANTQVNNLTVWGDLLVQGNTTTLSVGTLSVEDKNIVLANGTTSAAVADGAGITIEGANAIISYASSGDKITINKNFEVTGNLTIGSTGTSNVSGIDSFYSKNITVDTITANIWNRLYTANVTELNNLYYTDARVNTAVRPMLTTANVIETSSNLYYTTARVNVAVQPMLTTANVIETSSNLYFTTSRVNVAVQPMLTTANVIESSSNLYYTNARVYIAALDAVNPKLTTANVVELGNLYYTDVRVNTAVRPMLTTANVIESASNLYYTNARSRASLSSGIGITYNPATGVISANITSIYTDANAIASFTPYLTTANVIEASSNLYFTNARAVGSFVAGENIIIEANGRISAANVVSSYSIGTIIGDITTANVRELGNLYYTDTRVNTAVQPMLTTANVKETTNLYFTNARARAAITGGTGVSVDWATGVVSIGQNVSTTSNVTFGSVTVLGNLYVLGNSITFSTNTFIVDDTLIQLGLTNPSDALDIGFVGHYNDGSDRHSGIIRDHQSKKYFVFDNYSPDPGNDIQVSNAATEIRYSTLVASTFEGNVLGTVSSLANHTTSNLAEGTNQYYTDAKVNTAVRPMLTTANVIETSGNLYFTNTRVLSSLVTADILANSLTLAGQLFANGLVIRNISVPDTVLAGNVTGSSVTGNTIVTDSITANIWNRLYTSNVVETTNQYFTNVRVLQAVNPLLTTSNVTENSGILYFTPARARESLSSGSGITYESTTGVISANVQYTDANAIAAVNPRLTTANVIESSSNLYYTNARVYVAALDAVNPRLTTANVTELTNLYFTNVRVVQAVTPLLTSANVIESASNLYYTNARVYVAALDAVNPRLTTANVTELTNQYFTNVRVLQAVNPRLTTANVVENSGYLYFTSQRARESLSAGSGIAYDSTTGVISANTSQYFDANALAAIIPLLTTANVVETTNKYFTNTRVLDALATSNVLVNNLTVSGDLVVQGNTVILNTGTLNVEDKNLLLGNGLPNAAAADGAGITIDGAAANITYVYSGDKITVNKNFETTGNITVGSGVVKSPAGTSALTLSDIGIVSIQVAGVETKFGAAGIENSPGIYGGSYGGNKLSLNNETVLGSYRFNVVKIETADGGSNSIGRWTFAGNTLATPGNVIINGTVFANSWSGLYTANVIESSGNLYFTDARAITAVNPRLTTANVTELTNLYYTNARVNSFVQPFLTTANVTELTNLYYTNARVNSFVQPFLTTANVIETSSNLYFTNARVYVAALDAVNPRLTTANVIETSSNLYFTNARVYVAALDAVNPRLTTANVTELTNLYYTNARVNVFVQQFFTTANIRELGNLYYTDDRVNTAVRPILTTANVIETSGNLYFTNARVLGALVTSDLLANSLTLAGQLKANGLVIRNISVADSVLAGNVTGSSVTGNTIVTDSITANIWNRLYTANVIETSGNLYFTYARVNVAVQPMLTTANVIETSANLYFTNARVVSALSAGQYIVLASNGQISANITSIGGGTTVNYNSTNFVYSGNITAAAYIEFNESQVISIAPPTQSYTLTRQVADAKNIMVIQDGLVQIPLLDYTVSGTTLTFTETVTANSNVEVRYYGLKAADYIAPSLLATVNTFVGDGNTSYTLSLNPVSKNYLEVNIDGVIQLSDTYNVSSKTLTFTEAPPSGANIDVRIWSGVVNASFAARTFTGTGTTTQFSISSNLTAESILVFENGVAQVPTIDYTYSGGIVTFTTAPAANVVIQVRELGIATPDGSANVINAIRNRDLQTNNLFPTDDGLYDLGTTGARYRNVYSSNTVTSSNIVSTVGVTTNIVTANIIQANVVTTPRVQANVVQANTIVSTTVQANTLIVKPSSVPYYPNDYGVPGTIAWSNAYIYVCTAANTWTRATLFTWPAPPPPNIDYLVLAGGGGGGSAGGGGGAGGFRVGTLSGLSGSITVTVGAGGTGGYAGGSRGGSGTGGPAANGSPSVFSSITSAGGGAGAGESWTGAWGGSGGGGPDSTATPGITPGYAGNTPATTPSQGNAGGNSGNMPATNAGGGGGGGAGGVGGNGSSDPGVAGAGGIGTANSITGTSVTYASGGGGGGRGSTTIPPATAGGGGIGASSAPAAGDGTPGLGGGGGGGGHLNGGGNQGAGGSGGAGVVILSYPADYSDLASVSAGLVCNGSAGNAVANTTLRVGYKIYQFTSGTGTISWG